MHTIHKFEKCFEKNREALPLHPFPPSHGILIASTPRVGVPLWLRCVAQKTRALVICQSSVFGTLFAI
jgi:hypothetical protein